MSAPADLAETDSDDVENVVGHLEAALDDVDPANLPADAGHAGRLVGARCVGCSIVRLKLAPPAAIDTDTGRRESFKHVCHAEECRGVTWWNILAVRGGESDQ